MANSLLLNQELSLSRYMTHLYIFWHILLHSSSASCSRRIKWRWERLFRQWQMTLWKWLSPSKNVDYPPFSKKKTFLYSPRHKVLTSLSLCVQKSKCLTQGNMLPFFKNMNIAQMINVSSITIAVIPKQWSAFLLKCWEEQKSSPQCFLCMKSDISTFNLLSWWQHVLVFHGNRCQVQLPAGNQRESIPCMFTPHVRPRP